MSGIEPKAAQFQIPSTIRGLIPTAQSTNYQAVAGDFVVATAGITITLPDPTASVPGDRVGVYQKSVNTVTVTTPTGTQHAPGGGTGMVTGLLAANANTGNGYVVVETDGTDWYVIAGGYRTNWTTPALGNGYASVAPVVQYMRSADGFIYLRGTFSTLGTTNTSPFTLTANSRPSQTMQFPASVDGKTLLASVLITAGGILTVQYSTGATSVSIDGITYLAEA